MLKLTLGAWENSLELSSENVSILKNAVELEIWDMESLNK